MAERRVEVRGFDPHFLDHVGVGRRSEPPIAAIVGRAIDRPFVPAHATRRRGIARGAVDKPLCDVRHGSRRVHAGHEAGQQHRHVRKHRKGLDAATIEILPGREDARIEDGRLAGHGDGFADGSYRQRQVYSDLLSDSEDDATANCRLEACQLGRHPIVAGKQQRRFVIAAAVSCQRRRDVRVDIRDRDADAGHAQALFVDNASRNRSAGFLRGGGADKGDREEDEAAEYAQGHASSWRGRSRVYRTRPGLPT